MKRVSQLFLDDLRDAHGQLLKTRNLLGQVVDGHEYVPLDDLTASLHSMSCEAALPGRQTPSGYVFGSGLVNPVQKLDYRSFTSQFVRGGHGLVSISNTQASQMIERTSFVDRVRDALWAEGSPFTEYEMLHGHFDEAGLRQPGFWDDLSRGYAQNAHGMVVTVTPNSRAHRVFVQTELPELIANEDVETINGLSRGLFADYYDALRAAGVSETQAFAFVDRDVVQGSSVAFIRGYSKEFQRDLGATLRHDFDSSHTAELQEIFADAHPKHTLFAANDPGTPAFSEQPEPEPAGHH